MKIGICSTIENINKVEELGYDYIELPVTAVVSLSEKEFEVTLERVKNSKIKCEAFNILFPKDVRLVGNNVNNTAVTEYIAIAMKRVSLLGGKIIVFGSGGARRCPENWDPDVAWKQLRDTCIKLGDEAAKYDITIVIEPLNKGESNIVNSVSEGLKFVKDISHPNIKLLADFYHMRIENESMDIIKEAGKYLKHCHIANSHGRGFPLAYDEDDYEIFLDALESINYEGNLSIEGITLQFDIEASLSLKLLKNSK